MTDIHTDSHAPVTEPQPAPMFHSGAQPSLAPNTEPHPAPIFDTGPHPDPLGSREVASEELVAEESAEGPPAGPQSEVTAEPSASAPQAFSELDNVDTDAFLRSVTGHPGPVAVHPGHVAQPVAVPGSYQFVRRWKFAAIVAGVWLPAAAAGAGFYYWWYTSLDKTLPVFGILLFVVACMVAAVLVSMVQDRPNLSALSIALMAAPVAALGAAALLHGAYYFEWITRPTVG